VTWVGGVEVSNQSAVPAPRFDSATVPLVPLYWVMTLYSRVVPSWLRKDCRVVA
jgi:hypothetical protein